MLRKSDLNVMESESDGLRSEESMGQEAAPEWGDAVWGEVALADADDEHDDGADEDVSWSLPADEDPVVATEGLELGTDWTDPALALDGIETDDTLSLMIRALTRAPLLSHDQEVMLAQQIEAGRAAQAALGREGLGVEETQRLEELARQGRQAREAFIEANTRLVISVARVFQGQGLPFPDLIQAGTLGLIKAVDRFDYRMGNRFSTYATWWVRQSVRRTLKQQQRTIRLPVHMHDQVMRVYRAMHQLRQKHGRSPTPEELAETLELPVAQVTWVLQISRPTVSLNQPVGEDEDGELGDFVEDETALTPVELVEHEMMRNALHDALQELSPREAMVVRLHYGLDGTSPQTLRDVGVRMGLSGERVRQIKEHALRKMRHPRAGRQLRQYLR